MKKEPVQKRPLTPEEIQILKELDNEFDADQPKTRRGNLLPGMSEHVFEDIWFPTTYSLEQKKEALVKWNSTVPTKRHKKAIGGVFSKLANRYGWSSWGLFWVRAITFSLMIGGLGTLIPVYILAMFLMPDD